MQLTGEQLKQPNVRARLGVSSSRYSTTFALFQLPANNDGRALFVPPLIIIFEVLFQGVTLEICRSLKRLNTM